jgi:hypothetical protein
LILPTACNVGWVSNQHEAQFCLEPDEHAFFGDSISFVNTIDTNRYYRKIQIMQNECVRAISDNQVFSKTLI